MTDGASDADVPQAPTDEKAGRAASLIFAGILASRVLGLVRTRMISTLFGLEMEADAYNAALRIPNALRNLLGEGATSASFIPVYSALLAKGDTRAAGALAGALLGIMFAFVSVLTIIGIALSPVLAHMFVADPATAELATRLMRVLFPMTGLMVISGWCLGVQNAHRRFFLSYASAALWSAAQIALLAVGGSRADSLAELAWWLAWATLVGAVLQVIFQLPQALSLARPIRLSLAVNAPGVRQTLRNFAPVVIALGVVTISSLIDTWIAGKLPEGAISALTYATLIYTLPISLFGISVAASSLPEFSREQSGAPDALRDRLRNGWVRILFYIIPSTIVLIAFGDLVIELLLRGGAFGATDAVIVWLVLAGYAGGLIAYASSRLLASAFHALQDYRTPLRSAVASLVLSAVLALSIAFSFRDRIEAVFGLALGSAVGAYLNLFLLSAGLRRRMGAVFTPAMWRGTWRIVWTTLIAAGAAFGVRWIMAPRATGWIVAIGTLGSFSGIYLLIADRAGSTEAARLLRMLRLRRPAQR